MLPQSLPSLFDGIDSIKMPCLNSQPTPSTHFHFTVFSSCQPPMVWPKTNAFFISKRMRYSSKITIAIIYTLITHWFTPHFQTSNAGRFLDSDCNIETLTIVMSVLKYLTRIKRAPDVHRSIEEHFFLLGTVNRSIMIPPDAFLYRNVGPIPSMNVVFPNRPANLEQCG